MALIKNLIRAGAALTILMNLEAVCLGQASVQNAPRLTMQGPSEQTGEPIFRDASGRPCLDVEAAARAHVVNPDVLDHVVSIKNNCPRTIKLRVCYFQTDRCKEFPLAGYKRQDTILGTMTKISTFRYSIKQMQ